MTRCGGALAVVAAGLAVGLAAAEARGTTDRAGSAATRCSALPPAVYGWYRRVPADRFKLWLGRCRFQATRSGRFLGAGDYTLIDGDRTAGRLVLSNDLGCRGPASDDLPTPYRYSFDGYLLRLDIVGGADNDRCPPRARELGGRQLVKVLEGRVRVALLGGTYGSFGATGAFADSGSFARGGDGSRATLRGRKGSLVVSIRRGRAGSSRWSIVRGTGSYVGLRGGGTGRRGSGGDVLTGSITNER